MEKVDIIGRIIGDFGKWQLRSILLIFLFKIPSAWFMACIIFTAPEPRRGEFFCHPSEALINQNTTEQWHKILKTNKMDFIKTFHPMKTINTRNVEIIDFCNVFADASLRAEDYFNAVVDSKSYNESDYLDGIVPCEKFIHHANYQSIITDYDLVCSRNILVATTQFFHLCGVLAGGIFTTYLFKQ